MGTFLNHDLNHEVQRSVVDSCVGCVWGGGYWRKGHWPHLWKNKDKKKLLVINEKCALNSHMESRPWLVYIILFAVKNLLHSY